MNCGNCAEGAVEPLEVLSKISGIYKYSYEVSAIIAENFVLTKIRF